MRTTALCLALLFSACASPPLVPRGPSAPIASAALPPPPSVVLLRPPRAQPVSRPAPRLRYEVASACDT